MMPNVAAKGKLQGRRGLEEVAGIVTPETRGEAPSGPGQLTPPTDPVQLEGLVQCRERLEGVLKF